MSTIWLVSETDRVVPVARIRLIERDGFADLDRDLWRRTGMPLELVIASFTGEKVHLHAYVGCARGTGMRIRGDAKHQTPSRRLMQACVRI